MQGDIGIQRIDAACVYGARVFKRVEIGLDASNAWIYSKVSTLTGVIINIIV